MSRVDAWAGGCFNQRRICSVTKRRRSDELCTLRQVECELRSIYHTTLHVTLPASVTPRSASRNARDEHKEREEEGVGEGEEQWRGRGRRVDEADEWEDARGESVTATLLSRVLRTGGPCTTR